MSYIHNPTGKHVIIIGGVGGGASTAARLRRLNESINITIIEKGPFASFANCGLPFFIGNTIPNDKSLILVGPAVFSHKFNINLQCNCEVLSINKEKKTIQFIDYKNNKNTEVEYDYLVVSTGNKPIRPTVKGSDLPNIFTMSNIPEGREIKSLISNETVKKVVVIGSRFIGLEMVENFKKRGLDVTILESSNQLYPQLDIEMSTILKYSLLDNGIKIIFEDSPSEFVKNGLGLTVHTSKGEIIEADLVFLDLGVKPNTDLAIKCGLEIGVTGGIKVNGECRTSDPFIYACGDAIEEEHFITKQPTLVSLASGANRQGRVVADSIAGKPRNFRGIQGTAVCGVFGNVIATVGLNEKELKSAGMEYTAIYVHTANHVEYYPGSKPVHMKLLYNNSGEILGGQAIGTEGIEKRIDVLSAIIQMRGNVEDLMELELCYTPQFNGAKDPLNYLGMIATNNLNGLVKIADWNKIDDHLVLDIRNPVEMREGFVPGSINIQHCDLRQNLHLLPKNKPIYVICREGKFAYNACRTLTQSGFDVSLLSGGIHTYRMVCGEKLLKGSAGNRPESFGCCSKATKFG